MTSAMGSRRLSRVVRGTIKKEKNHHLVILGMLEIQLEISFWASMAQMSQSALSVFWRPRWQGRTPVYTRDREKLAVDALYLERAHAHIFCVRTRRELAGMEVPTLSQLNLLLQEDRTFRDYFNIFLSLPVRKNTMCIQYHSHLVKNCRYFAEDLFTIMK